MVNRQSLRNVLGRCEFARPVHAIGQRGLWAWAAPAAKGPGLVQGELFDSCS